MDVPLSRQRSHAGRNGRALRGSTLTPLRNRVTPFGEVVALEERGLLMGNRGVLHDGERQIVRAWQVRRWIACRLEFRGRRRPIMRPRSWTELFFLDEATAFAAGHRPCAECRNADYRTFRALWERNAGEPAGADVMDAQLHRERLDGRGKRTHERELGALPDGTFVVLDGAAWLVWGGALLRWTPAGYTERRARSAHLQVGMLTPPSIAGVFAAGYRPALHPSA